LKRELLKLSINPSDAEIANFSAAQIFATLGPEEQAAYLASLSPESSAALRWSWAFWARKNQLEPPGDWTNWLILAGRGFGKTRTGAETVRSWVDYGIPPP
jgi:hypothetical protein